MTRRVYSIILKLFLFFASASGFSVSPLFSSRRQHHHQQTAPQPLTHLPTAATLRPTVDAPSVADIDLRPSDARQRVKGGWEAATMVAVAAPIGLDDVTAFSAALARAVVEDLTDLTHTLASALLGLRHPVAAMLGLLPPWARFFAQPLLAAVFVPLFLLRTLAQPRPKVQWSGAPPATGL